VYFPGSTQQRGQERGTPRQIFKLDMLMKCMRTIAARAEAV
jgi:hypothetical protein